jgi:hypothetical protein
MDLNTPSGSTKKPARISLSCKSQSLTEREKKVRHLPCSTCNPTFRCHSTCLLDLRELGEQVLRQGPAEDVEIRPDPPLVGALREHAVPHLDAPAQRHLRRRLPQRLRRRDDGRVLQHRARLHRRRARRAQRRVGLPDRPTRRQPVVENLRSDRPAVVFKRILVITN